MISLWNSPKERLWKFTNGHYVLIQQFAWVHNGLFGDRLVTNSLSTELAFFFVKDKNRYKIFINLATKVSK